MWATCGKCRFERCCSRRTHPWEWGAGPQWGLTRFRSSRGMNGWLTNQGPLARDPIGLMTTDFCPSPRGAESGRGAEASQLAQQLLPLTHTWRPLSSHVGLLAHCPPHPESLLRPSLLGQSSRPQGPDATGSPPPKLQGSHTAPLF